jgi:hypothetical protein
MKSSKFRFTLGLALTCAAITLSLAVRAQAESNGRGKLFGDGPGDGRELLRLCRLGVPHDTLREDQRGLRLVPPLTL